MDYCFLNMDFHSFFRAFRRTLNCKRKTRPPGPYVPGIELLACKIVVEKSKEGGSVKSNAECLLAYPNQEIINPRVVLSAVHNLILFEEYCYV